MGEAEQGEGVLAARLNTLWYRGIWGTEVQPALGMRSMSPVPHPPREGE